MYAEIEKKITDMTNDEIITAAILEMRFIRLSKSMQALKT